MIEKLVGSVSIILIIYLSMSFVDVNLHNTTDKEYADWNIITNVWRPESNLKTYIENETKKEINDTKCVVEEENIEEEVEEIIKEEVVVENYSTGITYKSVSEEDIDLMAHLIYAEAGSDWCSDELILSVGSVVLNRMADDRFPDTLEGVIYQAGQYSCTFDDTIDKTPNERCYRLAEQLLTEGSILPSNVVFQAGFTQGDGIYKVEQNVYFCYLN